MSQPSIQTLLMALAASWSKQTSSTPKEWTESNPARGQCMVSSLIIQDYLGGDLGRFLVTSDGFNEKHHFNQLTDHAILDSTHSQYQGKGYFEPLAANLKGYPNAREKALSNDDTKARYLLLKEGVTDYLSEST